MIGRRLGHYRIVQKIGAGGMGEVYRANDEQLDRDVALKVLPIGALADETARKRFRKEAQALAKLSHPNIGVVHEFDTHDSVDFLAMEYIPGSTLREKLAAGSLPEKEVATLGGQIAAALEEAHEQGVVHRDLKPGNILVTPKGQAKVLDFGLAKLLKQAGDTSATETLTETQAGAGTLPYMAPEQLRGEAADARTDIFALGNILYEMATGERPFGEALASRLIEAILREAPAAPRAVNPRVSAELERIILKCSEKDPENRFQSAKELAVDLRRLVSPSAVLPIAARRRFAQYYGRHAIMVAFLAVVLIAVMLVGLNVGGTRDRLLGRTAPPPIESLAVLPLANLSGDPTQEYFADGMTDALIINLSRISALRVISRTSAMRMKGSHESLQKIARALNVDAIVEGSVLRSGDQVRISAELIDARADRTLWTNAYEGNLQDILALQSRTAQAIAQEIRIQLAPNEQARLAKTRRIDPGAYQLYLKGRFYWNKRSKDAMMKSLDFFQQAIAKDPSDAQAYAGLAEAYLTLVGYHALAPQEAYPLAETAARKALELDESLAEAHSALAVVIMDYRWKWEEGFREFERAIQLNPGYATAHQWHAEALMRIGRSQEAIAEIQRAQELDPLSLPITAVHGVVYDYARRPDEAITQLRKAVEMDESFYPAHVFLGWSYEQKEMYAEAIAELQNASESSGGEPFADGSLAHACALAGQKTRATQLLNKLKSEAGTRYVDPFEIGLIYAGLGDKDQAFTWIDKAFAGHTHGITLLKTDPRLDSLRPDPRFQNLLAQVAFPRD